MFMGVDRVVLSPYPSPPLRGTKTNLSTTANNLSNVVSISLHRIFSRFPEFPCPLLKTERLHTHITPKDHAANNSTHCQVQTGLQ